MINYAYEIKNEECLKGGSRVTGCYKKSEFSRPLISIITVVLNRRAQIEATIKSVFNQSYNNIEYIIIDGHSTDGTLDVIKKYEHNIDYWISESDNGLYEAMNKGILACSGDWILLLNSDDKLLNENVLESVSMYLCVTDADIIHGDMNIRYPSGRIRTNKPLDVVMLKKKMCLNHGSCFIKKNVYQKKLYDTKYKIAADYDLLLWAYLAGHKFEYINENIIEYSSLGLTGTPNYGDLDSYKIWKKNYGFKKAIYLFIKDQFPKFIKVPLKKIMIIFGIY